MASGSSTPQPQVLAGSYHPEGSELTSGYVADGASSAESLASCISDPNVTLGRIQFRVGYDFHQMTLTLKIICAVNLPAKDFSGTSDPYVKIILLPDRKHKLVSGVKRKNLNPHWNESFAFEGTVYKLSNFYSDKAVECIVDIYSCVFTIFFKYLRTVLDICFINYIRFIRCALRNSSWIDVYIFYIVICLFEFIEVCHTNHYT